MSDRYIYTASLPNASQVERGSSASRAVENDGLVSSGVAHSTPAATKADSRSVSGQYRGARSRLMATELKQLFGSSGFSAVPYFTVGEDNEDDGYYALRSVDISPLDARVSDGYHSFSGVMDFSGTRKSRFRSVSTAPVELDNDFGNDQTTYVGVDARANMVRWFEPTTGSTESPSPVSTAQGEFGSVELYDLDASGLTGSGDAGPKLVYDLPYEDEGKTDVRVWDTRGEPKTDANGYVNWQKVYTLSHVYAGAVVLSNGVVRLTVDESASSVSAERWSSGSWSSVSLGASDWVPRDVDVWRISPAGAVAQVRFEDTANPGNYYSLNGHLWRGRDSLLWESPDGETGVTPAGLVDLLDPVAETTLNSPGSEAGLVNREEVRK